MRKLDLTNQKFHMLTVITKVVNPKTGVDYPYWICQCDCGNLVMVQTQAITGGNTRSCGCLRRKNFFEKNINRKHEKICRYCGKDFLGAAASKTCPALACQEQQRKDRREFNRLYSLEYARLHRKKKVHKDNPPTSNRKCRDCGKDPTPNILYCPRCQSKRSDKFAEETTVHHKGG